jgi:hypothetical protein
MAAGRDEAAMTDCIRIIKGRVRALALKNKTLAYNNKTRASISANSPVASQVGLSAFFQLSWVFSHRGGAC